MSPRRTNLALLVVLVAALVSGGLAFAAGTGWGRPVLVAHGLAGLAGLGPLSAMQVHVGAALAAVLLLAVEGATRLAGLAAARRRFTGSLPVAAAGPADPGRIPVTQRLDDRVQVLDPDAWRLRVTAGGSTRDWTYAEPAGFGDRVEAVLDCTGGLVRTRRLGGVAAGPAGRRSRSTGLPGGASRHSRSPEAGRTVRRWWPRPRPPPAGRPR
jgi:hypothetical protein